MLLEQIREHDLQAIQFSQINAHLRMRPCVLLLFHPCVLQLCVFMSSLFTKGRALTFPKGTSFIKMPK